MVNHKSLPGIGEFFARLIDAEIDDIGRFRSAGKLAAYAGPRWKVKGSGAILIYQSLALARGCLQSCEAERLNILAVTSSAAI
jgi:transposase